MLPVMPPFYDLKYPSNSSREDKQVNKNQPITYIFREREFNLDNEIKIQYYIDIHNNKLAIHRRFKFVIKKNKLWLGETIDKFMGLTIFDLNNEISKDRYSVDCNIGLVTFYDDLIGKEIELHYYARGYIL